MHHFFHNPDLQPSKLRRTITTPPNHYIYKNTQSNRDKNLAGRFFSLNLDDTHSSNRDVQRLEGVSTSDLRMVNSAFGQASTTAKGLNKR